MKIILYGAGEDGVQALYDIGKENIISFIDTYKTGEIEGIPIKSLDEFENEKGNILVIITSNKYYNEISNVLEENGFEHYILYKKERACNQNKRLEANAWGNIYNTSLINYVVEKVEGKGVSIWTDELMRLTNQGDKILEIGCGSGETSLYLAKHGRIVSAIDYSQNSLELLQAAASKLHLKIDSYCMDATKELLFKNNEFDVAFQAGLLEHFEKNERIEMLKLWKPISKKMISMIPNSHSLAYQMGKKIAEENKTWEYGLELPQCTLIDSFVEAGYHNIKEYTIGFTEALSFLPNGHYLKIALQQWYKDYGIENLCGQGYLLVTIGE